MIFKNPFCPICHLPAIGTCEIVPGCALFKSPPRYGVNAEWVGETKMHWDEQVTAISPSKGTRLQCPEGHRWWTPAWYDGQKKPAWLKETLAATKQGVPHA